MKKNCYVIFCILLIFSCSKAQDNNFLVNTESIQSEDSIDSLNGKTLGIRTGSLCDGWTQQRFPDSPVLYYSSNQDLVMALKQGKIASYMDDQPVGRYAKSMDPELDLYPTLLFTDSYGLVFSKTECGKKLQTEMNQYLNKIKNDGTLDLIDKKWFNSDTSKYFISEVPKGKNGIIKLATSSSSAPFSMVVNNKVVGYEVDVVSNFCIEYDYSLEIFDMDFGAIIPGIVSSKYDIGAACISITEERAKSVHFSEPDYLGGIIMMKLADKKIQNQKPSFFESLKTSFKNNFIIEDRYKMILSGLWVTIEISILSAIFGTIIGFGLCMQRLSKNKILNSIAAIFIRMIQGLPIVVFLMILYYIIFAKSNISAIIVAVIGFSINFGAYVSEMMRTGIKAVDKGQIEAANAIGFNKIKTFTKIILPQAARHFIPVFKGEFISMVKMTSVVGYIAIPDLTRASDIIRSRTYEAFFPLISTAIIYFVIAYIFIFLIGLIDIKLDPKHRSRKLKGVKTI